MSGHQFRPFHRSCSGGDRCDGAAGWAQVQTGQEDRVRFLRRYLHRSVHCALQMSSIATTSSEIHRHLFSEGWSVVGVSAAARSESGDVFPTDNRAPHPAACSPAHCLLRFMMRNHRRSVTNDPLFPQTLGAPGRLAGRRVGRAGERRARRATSPLPEPPSASPLSSAFRASLQICSGLPGEVGMGVCEECTCESGSWGGFPG